MQPNGKELHDGDLEFAEEANEAVQRAARRSTQTIELRATINAAQEIPVTTSRATGTGIMFYNMTTNTYDLFVRIDNYSNAVTDTHIQEGAAEATGPAIVHAGDERVYTRTNSSIITVSFLNQTYPGDRMKLLQNGAYLNFHSAEFPRGEVRGQLITQPKRLVANINVAQEQAAFPGTTIASRAFGAAVMTFDPGSNVSRRLQARRPQLRMLPHRARLPCGRQHERIVAARI